MVELLVVIAIFACLVGLMMPAMTAVRQRSDCLKCASNLRQIGVATLLYVSDHGGRTPIIEPWPTEPVYAPSDAVQTISQVLGPYGVSSSVLQCPSDLKGPNYFAKEGSSYQWFPGAGNQNTHAISVVLPRMDNQTPTLTMSELYLAFDYSAVHSGSSNVLYGDGHVAQGD